MGRTYSRIYLRLGLQRLFFIVDKSADYFLDEWISYLVNKMSENVEKCGVTT